MTPCTLRNPHWNVGISPYKGFGVMYLRTNLPSIMCWIKTNVLSCSFFQAGPYLRLNSQTVCQIKPQAVVHVLYFSRETVCKHMVRIFQSDYGKYIISFLRQEILYRVSVIKFGIFIAMLEKSIYCDMPGSPCLSKKRVKCTVRFF